MKQIAAEAGRLFSGQPSDSASLPPKPALTMATVRRRGAAQRFRPYTGPMPPAISEAEALGLAEAGGEPYSLGLWDVGMMYRSEGAELAAPPDSVQWHSVWVIASVTYSEDVNEGGASGGSAVAPQDPLPPKPGWTRAVHMLDAQTGEFFLAYVF